MLKTPELDSIIRKVQDQTKQVSFKMLNEMIESVFETELGLFRKTESASLLLEREDFLSGKPISMTLEAIPEIAVTELGWTDLTGSGKSEVSGPERQKLMQFLENVKGGNFVEKIASLSRFYDDPDAALAEMFEDDPQAPPQKRIAVALSYMVFFKTLTKIISNFNAASAGFNFEAFLAVLTNGRQIEANTGTIADFISRADGSEVPVSLKLYQDKKLHVGGSFTDLVGDLDEPKFDHPYMRYIAVTKDFGGQKQGLDINGELKWYRFDFTVENVFDLLARSSTHSKKCILLPKSVVSNETEDYAATLPGTALPSIEEMESVFISAAQKEVDAMNGKTDEALRVDQETFDTIMKNLNWSKNDQLFLLWDPNKDYITKLKAKGEELPDDFVPQPLRIARGNSRMSPSSRSNKEKFNNIVTAVAASLPLDRYPEGSTQRSQVSVEVAKALAAANNGWYNSTTKSVTHKESVIKLYSKSALNDKRTKELNKPGTFANLKDSLDYYSKVTDPARKKQLLKQTYGYLAVEQFNLTQGMVEEIHTYSKNRVLPEGQSSALFGRIMVGNNNTQNVLNRMTTILNESIFEIFSHVKSVQENTYSYVANGMQDDEKANQAIESSQAIIKKTEELKVPTK